VKKTTRETGDAAEKIARKYLLNKGYRIIDTNWQFGHLELDIIAQDGDELVIVEVKSRIGEGFDHPLDAISEKKMLQVIDAAEGWIQLNDWNKTTRFDLIIVAMTGPDTYDLEHYDNAFNPTA
jgi:putative endonuclease